MKFFKRRIFLITAGVCLLPILLGAVLWNRLPGTIAIHFDIYGNPDNYAPKWLVVFGLPFIMAALQWVCCFAADMDARKHGSVKKAFIMKWIIPCLTVALQIITLGYALEWNIDVRRAVAFIAGAVLIVTGNYCRIETSER